MKAIMKEMNLKEMEKACGGIIVSVNGKYYVTSDPKGGTGARVMTPFDNLGDAEAVARMYGWSDKVYTQNEYREEYGRPFNP